MRLLLDTHVLIWWVQNNPRLGKKARQFIGNADNIKISIVSAWEYAIKKALGKLDLGGDFEHVIDREGFDKLDLTFDHVRKSGELKYHHSDPFDHMLVAQSMCESLVLMTGDQQIFRYPVKTADARI